MSVLEIAANIFNLLGVFLAARNHIATWPIGIIGCVLYGILFFQVKLYADVTLQFFYVLSGLYGWHLWKSGGDEKKELLITRVDRNKLALYSFTGLIVSVCYGTLLRMTTDASLPYVDSFILAFSVIGQLLMMQRKLESWAVWILVNTLSIPLFLSKGLYLTAAVYGLFWINAVWGHFKWRDLGRGVHP